MSNYDTGYAFTETSQSFLKVPTISHFLKFVP